MLSYNTRADVRRVYTRLPCQSPLLSALRWHVDGGWRSPVQVVCNFLAEEEIHPQQGTSCDASCGDVQIVLEEITLPLPPS